jgi:hypothetical protein
MLARECERNHAAIRSIRDAALHIKSKVEFPEYSFSVIATPAGHMRFSASHPELGASSHLLRPAQSDLMNRVMLDVAGLDRKLCSKLEAAYDAIVEIRHLRDSLIDYLSTKIDE